MPKFKTRGRIYKTTSGGGGEPYTFSGIDGITVNIVGRHVTIGNTSSGGSYTLTGAKFRAIGDLGLRTAFPLNTDGTINFIGSFRKFDKSAWGVKQIIPGALETNGYLVNGVPRSQYVPGGSGGYVLTAEKILAQANTTNFKLSNGKFDINDNVLTDATFSPEPSSGNQYGVYKKENKSYVKVPSGSGGSVTAQQIDDRFKPGELIISGLLDRKLAIDKSQYMLTSLLSPKPTTTPNLVLLGYVDGGVLKCGANVSPTPPSTSREGKFTRGSQVSIDNVHLNWVSNKSDIDLNSLDILGSLNHAKTIDSSIPTPTYNNLKNWLDGSTHTCTLELVIQHVGNANNRFQIAKSIGTGTSLISYQGLDSSLNGGLYWSGKILIGYNAGIPSSLNIQDVGIDWVYYYSKAGKRRLSLWRNPNNAANFSNDLRIDKLLFTMVTVKH